MTQKEIEQARNENMTKALYAETWMNIFKSRRETDLFIFWRNVRNEYKKRWVQAMKIKAESFLSSSENPNY